MVKQKLFVRTFQHNQIQNLIITHISSKTRLKIKIEKKTKTKMTCLERTRVKQKVHKNLHVFYTVINRTREGHNYIRNILAKNGNEHF